MVEKLRILLVEDSADDAFLLLRALRKQGLEIESERVETAEAMSDALEQNHWDLILSDYSLPRFSAPDALELMHEHKLDIPFIVISGTVGEDIAVETMKAGAHDYFAKGRLAKLGAAIQRELRDASIRRAKLEQEEDFRLLFETMPIGWAEHQMIFDADGQPIDYVFLRANRAFEEFTGLVAQEIIGRRVTEVIPDIRDAEPDLIAIYGEVVRSGEKQQLEIYFEPFERWYAITVFRRGEDHFVTMFEDATEQVRAQNALAEKNAELERSNRELEQFAYVASHDLQEPLRMVASYAQLLAQRYEGQLDEKADKYIHYAVDGAKRMQGLINDLLAYSRVGSRAVAAQPTDCGEVLQSTLRNLHQTIRESGGTVAVGAMPMVMADRSQLGQVFQNLISNAIKFRGDAPPRIEIKAQRSESMWNVTVADNGIGIDPQYHERIFTIFQRLHEREKYEGSGLGLAIVKKIVERQGGEIWLDSQAGEGSSFTFSLPSADSGPKRRAEHPEQGGLLE